MNRALAVSAAFGPLAAFALACGAGQATTASPSATPSLPIAPPDVELRDATGAVVGGKPIVMDGIAEGLAWPALRSAIARKPGDHAPLTIAVARSVPVNTVLRAVWTLRDADLRVQTPDPSGTPHVLEIRPKPDAPATAAPGGGECHLAVFVAADGSLRVATPGGPHLVSMPDAAGALARALASEREQCPIRYVAFGAESADAVWSAVFDVAQSVDREKSAGDARYVLAEPVHATAGAAR